MGTNPEKGIEMATWLVTRGYLRDLGACYSDEEIAALVPPDGVTIEKVLHAEHVPPEDRLWVATRPGVIDISVIRRWLGRIVRRALNRLDSPDARSLAVLPYLDAGGIPPAAVKRSALDSACNAAAYAAAAACNAAYSAAYSASVCNVAACNAAACNAADAAACNAADDADAADAIYAAERRQQITDLLNLLLLSKS